MNGIDLFCGCGGLTQGLTKSGVNIIRGYDNWFDAITIYRANHNHEGVICDISKNYKQIVEYSRDSKLDIIVGGAPCQDFSNAGYQIEGDRANLTKVFCKIIYHAQPKYFLFENVSAILRTKTYQYFKYFLREVCGYQLHEKLLIASNYNVPQKRKRYFCFGCIEAESLKRFNKNDSFFDGVKGAGVTSIKDYLTKNNINAGFPMHFYLHPRNYQNKSIYSIDELAPTIRGQYRSRSKNIKYHPNNSTNDFNMLGKLNHKHMALLQSFPHDYIWNEYYSKNTLLKMIGNAVPPNLAYAIGQNLVKL